MVFVAFESFRKMPLFVLLATLIFMAHPVHTEVVANIKSRDEILSFLNGTLALLLVFDYSKSKNWISLALAVIFFFLSLLSKETAMTTLAIIPFMLFSLPLKRRLYCKNYASVCYCFGWFSFTKTCYAGNAFRQSTCRY